MKGTLHQPLQGPEEERDRVKGLQLCIKISELKPARWYILQLNVQSARWYIPGRFFKSSMKHIESGGRLFIPMSNWLSPLKEFVHLASLSLRYIST
ncbi:hypothetical protein QQP08_004383 [Theobroma cacao]|nr:hypothetical protein QQP08_004383 [Theobroma cacao]